MKCIRGYRIVEVETETSQFDPHGHWVPGAEYYSRRDLVMVPARLKDDNIDAWLEKNGERKEIWLTPDL